MATNPFTEEIEVLERGRTATRIDLERWKTDLAWFNGVDLEQANRKLIHAQRMKADALAKLDIVRQGLAPLSTSVKRLEEEASMGIDPRHWFSSERAIAKRQLAAMRQKLADEQGAVVTLAARIATAVEIAQETQREIEKARAFDPLLAKSAVAALQATMDRLAPQLDALRRRSDALDEALSEPLRRLHDEEAERARFLSRIRRAEAFAAELGNASRGYEKAQIHSECDRELGDDKPGNIMRDGRKALRRIDANIAKLRARIDELVRSASLDIRHIVIDGNNLCYEGRDRFVGLAALTALVPILADTYKVTLIFDASIRRKLGLRGTDIEAAFPDAARVHIVASKRKADETVLDIAENDPYTFVLSNDRFGEFPDKPVVKEERLLQHEIVGEMVRIHDLRIATVFFEAGEQAD